MYMALKIYADLLFKTDDVNINLDIYIDLKYWSSFCVNFIRFTLIVLYYVS